jgi:hypothetical protein
MPRVQRFAALDGKGTFPVFSRRMISLIENLSVTNQWKILRTHSAAGGSMVNFRVVFPRRVVWPGIASPV